MKKLFARALPLLLAACSYEIKKGSEEGQGALGLPPGSVPSYAQVNEAVLAGKCATCHGVAGGNRGGLNFETYANVSASASAIAAAVTRRSMPPRTAPALSAGERNLLLGWITAGAPLEGRTGESGPGQPDPTQPEPAPLELTFASVFQNVLQPACVSCHGTRGGVSVESYDAVLDHKHDIVEAVESGFMPPRSRTPLTPEQKEHLLSWIRAGAPFN